MRIALLGAGRIGAAHAANLHASPQVSHLFIADADADRARAAAAPLGAAHSGDVEDAFADAPDAVVIATPTATHADLILRAVAAGVPVTVTFENPTDPSPPDQGTGFLFSYDFDNDGDYTSIGDIENSTAASATVTYPVTGTYVVRGRVSDQQGAANEFTTTVLVQNGVPSAVISNSGPLDEGGTATVTLTDVSHPSPVSTAAGSTCPSTDGSVTTVAPACSSAARRSAGAASVV